MQRYIGTKQVNAARMTRGEYNTLRGWVCPADENPDDDGYLVEYVDGGKANHPKFKGYISWSPKDVFERAYHVVSDSGVEQDIQAKGLTAPRITPADIEANIASEEYFTAAEGVRGREGGEDLPSKVGANASLHLLTFCVLVLKNGFAVTGESACASPENFDAEVGRKIARQKAIEKIWPLMGYQLRTELSRTA